MRIIGGKYKGRRIMPPLNMKARPTTDFAKEALFNILDNFAVIEGCDALDLFAGTGSISYELVSRDAASVTAVEAASLQAGFISSTAKKLGMDNLRVVRGDALKFIEGCRRSYDIIFADPPYDLPELGGIPDAILSAGMLAEDGMLILEHGQKHDFGSHPNLTDARRYGSVNFSFFSNLAKVK